MSVRKPPVSNRYLDLKEKEKAYRKHMSALSRARPTINTTQPEPARRIVQADKHSSDYRKNLIRHMKVHTQLMSAVSPRSKTKKSKDSIDWNTMSARRPTKPDEYASIDLFQNDYDRFRPKSQFKPMRSKDLKMSNSSSMEFEDPTPESSSDSQDKLDYNVQPTINKVPSVSSKSSSINPKVSNETIRIGYDPDERLANEKVKTLTDNLSSSSKSKPISKHSDSHLVVSKHSDSHSVVSKHADSHSVVSKHSDSAVSSESKTSSKTSKTDANPTNQLTSLIDNTVNALTKLTNDDSNNSDINTSESKKKSESGSIKAEENLSSNFDDSDFQSSSESEKATEKKSETKPETKDLTDKKSTNDFPSSLGEMLSGSDESNGDVDFDNFDDFE